MRGSLTSSARRRIVWIHTGRWPGRYSLRVNAGLCTARVHRQLVKRPLRERLQWSFPVAQPFGDAST